MDTFLVCVPMCPVAAFELIYCVWGRPLLRNICVSFSTVSTVILCPQWWSVTKYNYFVTVLKYIFQVTKLLMLNFRINYCN